MVNKSEKINKVKHFVLEYLDVLYKDSSSGNPPKFPSYELTARDYLEFAEEELSKNTQSSLINCISNLKRAMDCQLNTFLYSFNLSKIFNDRNLKFKKKLDFLNATGIFGPRSLARLNTIRNKMEHEYQVPKIKDIEVYYDLVTAFVSVLENVMLGLSLDNEMYFCLNEEYVVQGVFNIAYLHDKPSIKIDWTITKDGKNYDKEEFEANISNKNEIIDFAFFFRIFLLMHQNEGIASKNYILNQLKKSVIK
ncbi:hypothetical protein [Clostridium oceanicum]|uniref:RiboL-PSP-HEPN domain-containing protein n=1 Tax=Clostridium oceanicum TaxID=1543 RepID=A0ABN1JFS3_9CLOT